MKAKYKIKQAESYWCATIFPTLEARQTDKGENQNINHSQYLTRVSSSHSNETQDSENYVHVQPHIQHKEY